MLKKLRRAVKAENRAQVTARLRDDEWAAAADAADAGAAWADAADAATADAGAAWADADANARAARKKVRKILQKLLARYE